MGVSFRLPTTGKRYRHKPPLTTTTDDDDVSSHHNNKTITNTTTLPDSDVDRNNENKDISFTISLLPHGYSIGKPLPIPLENELPVNVPKLLHPYDRASETLFSAIECGRFPRDILDDIPCIFIDGTAFCEVRDYRTSTPAINKVCLRISLENIVKDIPCIADNDWTYGDLMEVESRILKAVQPQLCLDPAVKISTSKLNFDVRSMRIKRLLNMSQVAVSSDNKTQTKRVCLDVINSFSNNDATSVHGERHDQDWQSSPLTHKKPRIMPTVGADGNLPHLGPHRDNLHGSDPWKNTLMQQQSQMARIHQINQEGGTIPFTIGQQGIRYNLKEEPIETVMANMEQRMPQQFMRSSFSQSPRNHLTQPLDSNSRKDDTYQKRTLVQSPIMSVGLPQSYTSGANDNMQQQPRRKSNSLPKNPGISRVGSPSSVGTTSTPIKASSPHIGNQILADQSLLDRFSKIEVVTMRHPLNRKKNKPDENKNLFSFSAQLLARELSDSNRENFKDETCKMLSKSPVGGDVNACMTRILEFFQKEHVSQVPGVQHVTKAKTRMILSEKPNDGVVAIHIGEIDNAEYLATMDYLPTLPNTHMADLLAAQFCSLMARDGYDVTDRLEPYPGQMNHAPSIAQQLGVLPSTAELQQSFGGRISGRQPSNDNKPSTSGNIVPINSSPDVQQNQQGPRMNAQTSQISKGQQNSLVQPQQQFERSQMMFSGTNSMQHTNNILQNPNNVAHMESKPSSLQLQQLFQQHPPQMQRKIIAGLGTVGMGNIGNNMSGMGNFGNAMGLGGNRGVSAPMGNISNMGNNMNLSTASNISSAIRSGILTPEQVNHLKMRMAAQGRSGMMLGGSSQMSAARQMSPRPTGLPMFGSALNHRGDINQMQLNQMQRTSAVGGMGPPKIMSGMNVYMNQQQQMQQLQQMQQETASPLQQAVMSPQMGSPSMSQQASPQNMGQRTPMSPQLSGGTMHQMINGCNTEAVVACPSSPQVSGSVGSINNSSIELQGANKNNSQ